jgi:hypothetical protein
MKELLNQNYEVFTAKHAIYMILYGIEHNLPLAIRLAEKICSDYGYVVPSWVELRLNKYLITHSKEYSETINKIPRVNVANVYKKNIHEKEVYDNYGVESVYDAYKSHSIYAIDHQPFKGLEEIVDLKKFTMLMKNLNRGVGLGGIKI